MNPTPKQGKYIKKENKNEQGFRERSIRNGS